MTSERTHFPFTAIVGQEDMKDALVCNAVDPGIGGVLISGTRGTAKSTAARSLASLLPPIRTVADCPFNCPPDATASLCDTCREREVSDEPEVVEEAPTPFVTLPMGATEDRVLGTIDIEAAIQEGTRSFEPGLLARANRGILYIDEVNLLADHLVDLLLDVVAMGTNRVEREGMSVEHPADVMLVGTMNPEEGDLRPQLLDRFGLFVEADSELTPEQRKTVVRRRTTFEDDPAAFLDEWEPRERELADRIVAARNRLAEVTVPEESLDRIVDICIDHQVQGMRADVVIHRTARALAALDEEKVVREPHVTRAAELALGHRSTQQRSGSSDRPDPNGGDDPDRPDSVNRDDKPPTGELPGMADDDGDDVEDGDDADDPSAADGASTDADFGADGEGEATGDHEADGDDPETRGGDDEQRFPVVGGVEPPSFEFDARDGRPNPTGRRSDGMRGQTGRNGSYCRARRPRGRVGELAFDATLRAAAPHQTSRAATATDERALHLRKPDLREKVRRPPLQRLVVFVVDASGSMGAHRRMSAVKGAIRSLLTEAYQQRDYVALVGFRGPRATVLLPPTRSVTQGADELADLPTGGRTPLAAGLEMGLDIVSRERRKKSSLSPVLVLVTDGRPTHAPSGQEPLEEALAWADRVDERDVPAICIDTETGPVRMGLVRRLADRMDARYYQFDTLESRQVTTAVKDVFAGLGDGAR